MKKTILLIAGVCILLSFFVIEKSQIKESSNKPFVPSAPSSHSY